MDVNKFPASLCGNSVADEVLQKCYQLELEALSAGGSACLVEKEQCRELEGMQCRHEEESYEFI